MSTQGSTVSTAATMMSRNSGTKVTRFTIEGVLKDIKIDKQIKLETLIQYLEQIKRDPVEDYMKESSSFLSHLMPEFEGDKEHFLPWVRFLDIAYVHKSNKTPGEEEEAFKRGIEEIMAEVLLKGQKIKSIDWRIARKILSLNGHFYLPDSDLEQLKEGILRAFKAEIDIALEHLLWQEESLFVNTTKTILISLRQYFDAENHADPHEEQCQGEGQNDLLEAVRCGRFDKEKFKLKNSLVIGEDGGLYLLLNRMNQQQQDALISEQIVTKDYLKDKIKAKGEATGKDDKIVLGTGGFGTVRFALSLLRNKSLPAEIVCVKKTRSFQDLYGSYAQTPIEQIIESTLGDYFTNDRAQAIYSPVILDMGLVTAKNVIKEDMKDHRKGYLMMEILPQNTATRIFADKQYQKWEYQKPYLLDVLENTQKLLESDIAMTDLKPDNTLYDTNTRKATIIDLGGSIKVSNSKELFAFDITKYSFQSTPGFQAPELGGSQGVVNMHKALAYSCGKVIEVVTHKSDYNQQAISQIIKKLTATQPEERISLPEAISQIKGLGDDSERKNIIFSHYINKIKERLETKKSAISINEDIDKTSELFITLNSTSLDPSKYNNLKTEDLLKKIDDFLSPENTKQVMAIFGIAGSGKSIALQLKFIQAVHDWQPSKPLPVYFNLANGLDLDQIVRTLNTELDTNLSLDCLDGQHLYIDSFDEGLGIEGKRDTLIKEYFRKLGSPKILITCRTDYLQGTSYDWFRAESKELEVCYVVPINYNGHQDLPHMIEKYVCYSKQHTSSPQQQYTTQEYLDKLKELQITDLINTGFMFFLVMEVLFQLQDKKEGRVNKVDIYANYTSYYQNSQISKLKNQDQEKRLEKMILSSKSSNQQADLCSFATELGKYLACQMHLRGQARLGKSDTDKLFEALGYDHSLLIKHQSIIHMLKLLPVKIVTTYSGKRLISNQEVKIGFIHETIKDYYILESIRNEIEREGKSLILSSKSIAQDSELLKLIVLAMKDNPKFATSFLKAIENSKQDKSTSSITYASNSISLLIAAKHSFSGCDLSNIAVKGATIVNGIFHNAKLNNADLSYVDMTNVNITGASLNGADMRGANFSISPDLVGHSGRVCSVSFSPDGKLLASGSEDNTINIWNPNTGERLQTLNGHTDGVCTVSFSPDSKLLASGSEDKTINIWNPNSGECLKTLNGHTNRTQSVSFSPDGKLLASGSHDKTIKIWDPSTGVCLRTLYGHTAYVLSVSFSPDGKFLASASWGNIIRIWIPSTGECLQVLEGEDTFGVCNVSFSPDSKFIACGSWHHAIKIWDSSTYKCLQTLNGHSLRVKSISFSPDGKFLASGSEDNTIMIWNPSTGECLQTLTGHTDGIGSISFSPDCKYLAIGSGDNKIKIWSPNIDESLSTLTGHAGYVWTVSLSPDGKFLASGSNDSTIKIWNPNTGELLHTLNGCPDGVWSVSFSPDSKFLASGLWDETIKMWNPLTGELLQTLSGHTGRVQSVSFSPDGKFLASGSADYTIAIWNPNTGERLLALEGHTNPVWSISFSPDGKFLASGSYDKSIKIWNSSTGECLQTLNGHTKEVQSVSFSPNGNFLASGAEDKTIKIWNPSTGECLQTLDGHTGRVQGVCFSSDGKFLASGSYDKTIKIWDPSTGRCLQTLNCHTDKVCTVSFSSDGKFFASGSEDKTVKVFEYINNVWLLKNNITASPSPLCADGVTLKDTIISQNNKLVLEQKGAENMPSVIDNTISQIEHNRNSSSSESISTASQLSHGFLTKFIAHQQSQSLKLVTFGTAPGKIPTNMNITMSNPHPQSQDPKPISSIQDPKVGPSINLPDQVMMANSRPSNTSIQDTKVGPSLNLPDQVMVAESRSSNCCQVFVVSQIIYDNPLLNYPALFAQISQTSVSIQISNLNNM